MQFNQYFYGGYIVDCYKEIFKIFLIFYIVIDHDPEFTVI
jgi:hypothetical protein